MAKAKKKTAKKTKKKVAKKVTKKASTKKPSKKTANKAIKVSIKKASTKISQELSKKLGPQVGEPAPDFILIDQHGNSVSLKDFRGNKVVVYFYPKAMTPGCTVQACEIRNSKAELEKANIVVLGVSADPVAALRKFEEKEKLNFPLLSDPEKNVIKSYGAWGRKKFMGREFDGILRQSFLIDENGKIVHVIDKVDTKTHHQDVLNFFKNR